MAKKTPTTQEPPSKAVEIGGVALLFAAAVLFLSLLSHYVGDPSLNTVAIPDATPRNPFGRFGSYTSDLMIQFGGAASTLLPIILAVLGVLLYRRRTIEVRFGQVFGYFILLMTLATMAALFFDKLGGGIVGMALAQALTYVMGRMGSIMVAAALLIVALILSLDFSFIGATRWIGRRFAIVAVTWNGWIAARRARRARRKPNASRAGGEKGRGAPIIRDGEAPLEPAAREAKTKIQTSRPVRSTRLDADAAPPPEPSWVESPRGETPRVEAPRVEPTKVASRPKPAPPPPPPPPESGDSEEITIHRQAETVAAQQIAFSHLGGSNYEPPPFDLLQRGPESDRDLDREALLAQSVTLESKLETFGVNGHVVEIHPGPVITLFEYEPAAGVKVSKIANLEDDLAMALQAEKIRIIAPIPGKGAVGIEVPSMRREIVYLREILESKEFHEARSPLTICMGKDSSGNSFVQDLARMPHLLVAGTTGSGKSVFLNCVIMSIMFKTTPDQVRLLMVDPKQLELSMYTDTPHMLHPVITEPKKAAVLLRWAVAEMEERYRKLAEMRVRNIESYNKKIEKLGVKGRKGSLTGEGEDVPEKLPYIVLIIDELADLMMIAAKEVEESIARLAQMARAAGIHLIVATQRPSVDVITGVIKANFPSRIAFQVRSRVDSRTILDETGANNLLGMGDGLLLPPGAAKITRFHSGFVADEEVHSIVHFLKEKYPTPDYLDIRTASGTDLHSAEPGDLDSDDEPIDEALFDKAVDIVARDRKASVSYLQRRLKIGYNRAARLIERMEEEGMIAPSDGTSRAREIFLPERDYD